MMSWPDRYQGKRNEIPNYIEIDGFKYQFERNGSKKHRRAHYRCIHGNRSVKNHCRCYVLCDFSPDLKQFSYRVFGIHECKKNCSNNSPYFTDEEVRQKILKCYRKDKYMRMPHLIYDRVLKWIEEKTPNDATKNVIIYQKLQNFVCKLNQQYRSQLDFQKTIQGDRFLLFQIPCSNGKTIYCFASDFMLQKVRESSIIGIDGTFKVSPQESYQVVVFIGRTLLMNLPLLYLLLPDKKESTYCLAFNVYLNCFQSNGISFMDNVKFICDFELALINAILKCLMQKSSYLQLCYFHFTQTLKKYKMEFEKNQNSFALDLIKILKILPLINITAAESFIGFISKFKIIDEVLCNFITYFQETYTKTFPIRYWNITDKPMKDRATNNANESFNKKMNSYVNILKPSLSEFFAHIQSLENSQRNRYLNYERNPKIVKNKFYEEPNHNQITMFLFNIEKMKSKYEIFKIALKEEKVSDFGVKSEDLKNLKFKDIRIRVPVYSLTELNERIPCVRTNRKAIPPYIPKKIIMKYKHSKDDEKKVILSQILNNKNVKGRWKRMNELEKYINFQIKMIEHRKQMPKSAVKKVLKHQIRF